MGADPSRAIGQALMMVTADFQRRLDQDLRERGVHGIRARHRTVFLHLGRFGPCRSVDLAEAAGVRPQSMMKIVHELEDMGLVQRRTDPADSRAKLIDFTDRGRRFIVELSRSTETVWAEYASLIGEKPLRDTVQALEALVSAGGAMNPPITARSTGNV